VLRSLRTSTKLMLLCGVFVGALAVATYGLIAEKQIAIQFVRKELVGVEHLRVVRGIYASLLKEGPGGSQSAGTGNANETQKRLAAASSVDPGQLDTAALERALSDAIDKLASAEDRDQRPALVAGALTAARNLAARIGDDSNLTLDPDLDSFYIQNIAVTKMPALLSEIGEMQSALETPESAQPAPEIPAVRILVLDGMIRSTLEEIEKDLQASYRGGNGARLRQVLDADLQTMIADANAYLDTVKASLSGAADASALADRNATAANSAINAWTKSLTELKRLLDARLAALLGNLRTSLLLNGLLSALALTFALITGRHIVQPLLKLERLADEVGQTKDYKLRTDYKSRDEIGRLAIAFNAMLAELAAAREREAADAARNAAMQTELARVARVSTMGEMAASIAHEINQPLAAIVNNANASLRWLGRDPPNVERARSALDRVVSDGARASEVLKSIRAMLEKSGQERVKLDVNDLIREVMTFVRADLRHHGITVRTDLAGDVPGIAAVRIQLQQVLLNLVANAVESMSAVDDRARVLTVRCKKADSHGILITIEDTGAGIGRTDLERVFEPFFSTKPEGMGMGLSICRSIVEAHGGRIVASPARDRGSVFEVSLPLGEPSQSA
jgi:signal transduction histidine kinase